MKYDSIEMLCNPRLEELVRREYVRFKDIIECDMPIGAIYESVNEIALTEYLDSDKLFSLIEGIKEEVSSESIKKMQDIMYCNIGAAVFKELNISIYNAKRVLGFSKSFDLIKKHIQDPLIIGNVILLTLSINMETEDFK